MKNSLLVAFAVALAITFSAFTTLGTTDQLYYWDGDSMEEYNEGNECDPGVQVPCVIPVFGTLYTDDIHDDAYIYKKDTR